MQAAGINKLAGRVGDSSIGKDAEVTAGGRYHSCGGDCAAKITAMPAALKIPL
jgi:hypothetical protein